jgi:hypothetical protein
MGRRNGSFIPELRYGPGMIETLESITREAKEARMKLKLSAPQEITWWIAVIIGVLGILGHLAKIPFVSANDFWFVAVAFVLLAIATYVKNL